MNISGLFNRQQTTNTGSSKNTKNAKNTRTYATASLANLGSNLPASAQKAKAATSAQLKQIKDTITISSRGEQQSDQSDGLSDLLSEILADTPYKDYIILPDDTDAETAAKAKAEADAAEGTGAEKEQSDYDKYIQDRLDSLSAAIDAREQMDSAQQEAEAAKKEYENLGKCLEISRRILKGDKVPHKDMKFLMEKQPKLYKQSILLRASNAHPKKHKSLVKDEEESNGENAVTDDMKAQIQDLMNNHSSEDASGSADSETAGGDAAAVALQADSGVAME